MVLCAEIVPPRPRGKNGNTKVKKEALIMKILTAEDEG
jgi:hypothetical protein